MAFIGNGPSFELCIVNVFSLESSAILYIFYICATKWISAKKSERLVFFSVNFL